MTVKIMAALGIAMLVVSGLSVSAAAQTGHTKVVTVRPTDAYGHLKSGYGVRHTFYGGDCRNESEMVPGTDRCFAGSTILDPCWATVNSKGNYNGSFCPDAPWKKTGILVRGRHTWKYDPGRHVMAVQLRDGWRCGWAEGATAVFHGHRLNFYCIGHPHKWLVGMPNKSSAFWHITKVTWRNGHLYNPVRVSIGTAWIGVA